MALTPAERDIIEDNDLAIRATSNFLQSVNDELFARGTHLTIAVGKFTAFLNLPETPNKYAVLLSIAGTFLPMICPELFMAKWLGQTEEEVKRALALASALGNKGAKAVNAINKGKEVVKKVAEVSEMRTGLKEKGDKLEDNPGVQKLSQLDAADIVVNELITVSRKAHALWLDGTLAVHNEYKQRLDHPQPKFKYAETLEQKAKRLLPPPPVWTLAQLKEIEMLYLYQIIKAWVAVSVSLDDDVDDWTDDGGNMIHNVKRRGLNNTQEKTLLDLFGVQTPRGTVFTAPAIVDLDSTLQSWGARMTTHTHKRMYKGKNI